MEQLTLSTLQTDLDQLPYLWEHLNLEEQRELDRLLGGVNLLRQALTQPGLLMRLAGRTPDPWQQRLLESQAQYMILNCARQSGKTWSVAELAVKQALSAYSQLILILAPTERQSTEFLTVVNLYLNLLGNPIGKTKDTETRIHFRNGSRIIALPDKEKNVRCYSGVQLLIVDEAARVSDSLFRTIRPMLSISRGRLVVLSTPYGQRGFFHKEWTEGRNIERYLVPVRPEGWQAGRKIGKGGRLVRGLCPRHEADFLEDEKRTLGPRWYQQEYLCSFEAIEGAAFDTALIDRALTSSISSI
jgi:phage FluMu gp28-like protein